MFISGSFNFWTTSNRKFVIEEEKKGGLEKKKATEKGRVERERDISTSEKTRGGGKSVEKLRLLYNSTEESVLVVEGWETYNTFYRS